jgi:uncharacterized damage-inducible protein DinB
MMRRRIVTGLATAVLLAPALLAQAPTTMTLATKMQFDEVKGYLSKTAQKVPENLYSFKPTPEVRSFGQIIGHVADANFAICAAAAGEKPPQTGFEKDKTAKADLVKGLNDSIAYCDKVFASMNDQKGLEQVKFFNGNQTPRVAVLAYNNSHCNEHYGNLVTYMRLKGIIPPSSERGGA